MKELIKSSGIIILLLGVVVLMVGMFTETTSNVSLMIGQGLIVGGFVLHIYLRKKMD